MTISPRISISHNFCRKLFLVIWTTHFATVTFLLFLGVVLFLIICQHIALGARAIPWNRHIWWNTKVPPEDMSKLLTKASLTKCKGVMSAHDYVVHMLANKWFLFMLISSVFQFHRIFYLINYIVIFSLWRDLAMFHRDYFSTGARFFLIFTKYILFCRAN